MLYVKRGICPGKWGTKITGIWGVKHSILANRSDLDTINNKKRICQLVGNWYKIKESKK